jgi:hypothetical protein
MHDPPRRPDVTLHGEIDTRSLSPPRPPPPKRDRVTAEVQLAADVANLALAVGKAQAFNAPQLAMSVAAMAIAIAGDDALSKSSLAVYMAAAVRDLDEDYFEMKFLN